MRGQRPIPAVCHRAQDRVIAQTAGIIGVFVAGRDLIDPLAQQDEGGMRDVAAVTLIDPGQPRYGMEAADRVSLRGDGRLEQCADRFGALVAARFFTVGQAEQFAFSSSADGQELYCQMDAGYQPLKFAFR